MICTILMGMFLFQDATLRDQAGQALIEAQLAQQNADKQHMLLEQMIEEVRIQAQISSKAKDLAETAQTQADLILAEYLETLNTTAPLPPVGGTDLQQYLASLPFAAEMPTFPEYEVPTLDDCDWEVREGVFTSRRGLPDAHSPREAFRASRASGDFTVTIGVWDKIDRLVVGGLWNGDADHSVTDRLPNGQWATDLRLELVGLDEECEVSLSWGSNYGATQLVSAYNIGLRGPQDSFVIRANDGADTIILDGCWFLPHMSPEGVPQSYASGLHTDKWNTLILRRTKWRGEKPGTPGIDLREHLFYLKSSRGQTWVVQNDLMGGNRTGFQIRPDSENQNRPVGPVVIALNKAEGYGWNHGSTGGSFDGGSCITVWANPEGKTFIAGNEITDAKYGCLVISGQSPERDWRNENGYAIHKVWVWDNVFENSQTLHPGNFPRRGAVAITGVEQLHWGPNTLLNNASLTLNNEWGMIVHGVPNGEVLLYDRMILQQNVLTYDGTTRPMTQAELEALLVN